MHSAPELRHPRAASRNASGMPVTLYTWKCRPARVSPHEKCQRGEIVIAGIAYIYVLRNDGLENLP